MKKLICLILLGVLFSILGISGVVLAERSWEFEDLEGFEWAEEAIYCLFDKQPLLTGTVRFEPGNIITRAEFVGGLSRATNGFQGASSFDTSCFQDVSEGYWYYSGVTDAQKKGIVQGDGNGYFYPNDLLLRQDAAVIVVNFLTSEGVELPLGNKTTAFEDAELIDSYAMESVTILKELQIMVGNDNCFEPKRAMNRAEACVLLYQALQHIQDNHE